MRALKLLTALLSATPVLGAKRPKEAILLSTVKSLTLHANSLTTSRRLAPVPQLTCVGGSASKFADVVEVMRCTNSGRGYGKEDIEWTCQAELPEEFKLGSTQVVCEGYEGPEDEYEKTLDADDLAAAGVAEVGEAVTTMIHLHPMSLALSLAISKVGRPSHHPPLRRAGVQVFGLALLLVQQERRI
ncbi:hypothetical protein B0A48_10381 [Cryoendolithus antarcticus]|uniref:Store-operated calcium entry-associated regulatory factor n=1 Tax=Cryoendolithus antarcticus TaxID=1507870 RepID=A0A1V8SX31_9PEZI|nr:hypothetical protein B0A48_10381 [Cryoendolithus antarcticus]